MRITIIPMMVFLLCGAVRAEMRTWTLVDGRTVEAELFNGITFDDTVRLIDKDENELRIPVGELSQADRDYLDIIRVPRLDIDFLKSFPQTHFESKLAEDDSDVREPEIRASFGVRVRQVSSGRYNHTLTAEYFAVGKQLFVRGDRYILLARGNVEFKLNRENGRRFEYESEQWTPLREIHLRDFAQRGEKYHGYLILVTDELGNIVAHEESPDWLFDHLDNLNQLKSGNYFDDECVRRFPVRPEPLRSLSF